ncbi:MAG: hemerythrin domain-containing protein [Rhodospirillales bacterium]|nr:hemerythrin domain-containing protein [Rhodospirillales bacterium]
MVPATRPLDDPVEIEPIPENLLREPIDYLYAEHFRQRLLCKLLDEISFDPEAREVMRHAAIILSYLEHDLPNHIADEEEELFPRLLARCRPEDRIERVQRLLSEEHARDDTLSSSLLKELRSLTAGSPLGRPDLFARATAAFSETQRRHLAWEDELVLPLARERLTADDLLSMGRSMAARRGVDYPA